MVFEITPDIARGLFHLPVVCPFVCFISEFISKFYNRVSFDILQVKNAIYVVAK